MKFGQGVCQAQANHWSLGPQLYKQMKGVWDQRMENPQRGIDPFFLAGNPFQGPSVLRKDPSRMLFLIMDV